MKGFVKSIILSLVVPLLLSGCSAVGGKSTRISLIYGVIAVLSFCLFIGYCLLIRKKTFWFLLLFLMVSVVNCGYFGLSGSTGLEQALMFNRLAYLGSVFLPMTMFMIIVNTCNHNLPKWLTAVLVALCLGVFIITASPGYSDIYYKSVDFIKVDGAGVLVKEYGPWHPLYLFYLLGYFAAMLAVIIESMIKKRLSTPVHACVLLTVVLINIGVWFLGQLADINFEFLSVAYIASEIFLIALYMILQDIRLLVPNHTVVVPNEEPDVCDNSADPEFSEKCRFFEDQLIKLTPTERTVYSYYIEGKGTKEVMAAMGIKENTLKYHNKNIYSKLGVSSRKQLIRIASSLNEKKS